MSKELPPRPRGPSRGAPMPRGAWPTLPQRKARRSRACQKPAAAARWAFHPGLSAVLSRFPAGIRTPTEPPLLGGGVSRLAPARLLPRTEKALSARPGCPLTAASVVSGPRPRDTRCDPGKFRGQKHTGPDFWPASAEAMWRLRAEASGTHTLSLVLECVAERVGTLPTKTSQEQIEAVGLNSLV
ncbi:uncharacterized protein AAG666_016521 isoform 1-T1 [Megaptera novaeangliae]